jgi:hypothetical protein
MNPPRCLRSFVWLNSLALLLFGLRSVSAQIQIVYDNSAGINTNVYYSNFEYGDEIFLAGGSRNVTEFRLEYYGDFVTTGDETGRLRLYKNDGKLDGFGDPTPGTLLYDSGTFPITPGYQTKIFSGFSITVPTDLTWTIQFGGLIGGDGDRAGLIIQGPPTVGSSYDDFWLKSPAGTWLTYRWVELTANDVLDFPAIYSKLTNASPDQVSAYLWSHFQPGAKTLLQDTSRTLDDRKGALASALNAVIDGASIYDPTRFASVTLAASTQAMLARPPQYQDVTVLNRMLVDDTYPQAIAPRLLADFAAQVTALAVGPKVSIRRDSENVFVEWSGTSVLQVAPNANGPFTDLPTARNVYQFDVHAAASQFWRLRD